MGKMNTFSMMVLMMIFSGMFFGCGDSFQLRKRHIKFAAFNVTFQGKQKIVDMFYKLVNRFGLDVWKNPVDKYDYALVLVQQEDKKTIAKKFRMFGISEELDKIFDTMLKKSMLDEFDRIKGRTMDGQVAFDITDANTLEKMVEQLQTWKNMCPKDLKCRLIQIQNARTHEKNPIYMFSVGLNEDNKRRKRSSEFFPSPSPSPTPSVPLSTQEPCTSTEPTSTTPQYTTTTVLPPEPKKGIWIDCLIHAREWISGTTCMLFINEFINKYQTGEVKQLLEKYDWHFVPVMNPDGYKYSWGFDVAKPPQYPWMRLSRKNRFPTCDKFPLQHGVDLNRNYNDGHWCVTTEKAPKDPCSYQAYCGAKMASEKETQAIQTQLLVDYNWPLCSEDKLKAKDHLDLLLTVHNFDNAWMYPTARTVGGLGKKCAEIDVKIAEKLKKLAEAAEAASEKAGQQDWKSGPACEALKKKNELLNAPGNLMDFAFSVAEIVNSMAVELRGVPSFIIGDKSNIDAAFKEAWAGVVAIVNAL